MIPSFFRIDIIYRIIFIFSLSIFVIIGAIFLKKLWDNDAIFNENIKNNNIKFRNDGKENSSGPPKPKHNGIAVLVLLISNIIFIIIHITLIFTYKPIPKKVNAEESNGFPQTNQPSVQNKGGLKRNTNNTQGETNYKSFNAIEELEMADDFNRVYLRDNQLSAQNKGGLKRNTNNTQGEPNYKPFNANVEEMSDLFNEVYFGNDKPSVQNKGGLNK